MHPEIAITLPPPTAPSEGALSFLTEPCRYPHLHRWFLALAAIDVALTSIVLCLGGQEANVVPRAVLGYAGLGGMILLKTACVTLTLLACEAAGRRSEPVGRGIALAAIGANTIAAAMGGAYLTIFSAAAWL